MSSTNLIATIEIVQGSNGNYYVYNGCHYDIHYPIQFAIQTELCSACLLHGLYNGVFVGHCAKCIDEKYGIGYGNGFTEKGERTGYVNGQLFTSVHSVWNTYMKNVDINEIGCEALIAKLEPPHAFVGSKITDDECSKDEIQTFNDYIAQEEEADQQEEADQECDADQQEEDFVWSENGHRWTTKEQKESVEGFVSEFESALWLDEQYEKQQQQHQPISVYERMLNSAMYCGNN